MLSPSNGSPVRLVYQDQVILVADKPAGMSSQPDKTGADDLLNRLSRQLSVPVESLLPVHRLDRPVSGLLVIARTAAAQTALTRQMSSHETGKTYHCVVQGHPDPDSGELTDYLVKNERLNITKISNADNRSAKLSILTYRTIDRIISSEGQALALLQIELQTGRHHQIRVQLAHAGWPLWGDTKYNPGLHRTGGWHSLALCATGIRFRHPFNGKPLAFSRPLPETPPFSLFPQSQAECDKMKAQD